MDASPPSPHEPQARPLPEGWLRRYPWITFLFPFLLFMLLGSLEPKPSDGQLDAQATVQPDDAQNPTEPSPAEPHEPALEEPAGGDTNTTEQESSSSNLIPYRYYPLVYTARILLTFIAMALVWKGYQTFDCRLTPWGVAVGIVGGGVWIGICLLQLEPKVFGPLGLEKVLGLGERSAFNPLEELADNQFWAWGFLAIRFIGLVAVVPIIEEFFLRGLVMRYPVAVRWWEVPFGKVTTVALIAGTAVPMLSHPAEMFAAGVWFSMVTWLMLKTRSIWDCILAHAITNLILGVYVVLSGHWELM